MFDGDENFTSVVEQLETLGDPSGRQDALYWDKWFEIVGNGTQHKPFEWYCEPDQVLKVLGSYKLHGELSMMHPGSGTSVLPLKLIEEYPLSKHIIVDVSDIAIQDAKRLLEQRPVCSGGIEFARSDLLSPPIPFESESFDCWIDKGFLDAIFCSKNQDENRTRCSQLFGEANRVLRTDGLVVVITLGEKHSLELLLEAWTSSNSWDTVIHLWELDPSSGDKPALAFVFTKQRNANPNSNEKKIIRHSVSGSLSERTARIEDLQTIIEMEISAITDSFHQRRNNRSQKSVDSRKMIATLEIKPYEAGADLKALSQCIRTNCWLSVEKKDEVEIKWLKFEETGADENIVPIGYGICKLQLKCVVESDFIDDLVGAIEDWTGIGEFDEGVQSVDVDWSRSVPIGDFTKLLKRE